MANTYSSLHVHIVYSTKNRVPWITADIEQQIWEYTGGIGRKNQMKAIQVGGIEDHLHVVLGIRPTHSVSEVAQLLKGGSSRWIHETFPALPEFEWQDGYGAFTVSKSGLIELVEYVANQRQHHRTRTFQDEYRAILKKHEVDFDERYVWG